VAGRGGRGAEALLQVGQEALVQAQLTGLIPALASSVPNVDAGDKGAGMAAGAEALLQVGQQVPVKAQCPQRSPRRL
jgi:hypothetical protein